MCSSDWRISLRMRAISGPVEIRVVISDVCEKALQMIERAIIWSRRDIELLLLAHSSVSVIFHDEGTSVGILIPCVDRLQISKV